MQAIKSLTEHMNDVRERLDRKESDLELNIFAEEIKRARNVTIDTVRDELPNTVIEPYGKVEFFPEYDNPPGYEQWLELRKEGFTSQPIPGMNNAFCSNRGALCCRHLKYKNSFFPRTYRFEKITPRVLDLLTCDWNKFRLLGTSKQNKKRFFNKKTEYGRRLVFGETVDKIGWIYMVGIANDLEREPTQEELRCFAKESMFKYVFGIKPPTEQEILNALLRAQLPGVSGLLKRYLFNADYMIRWCSPENLNYPMPRGVFYTYKDAKESGIFEDLEFGLLEERRRVVDPVLAGKYKGFRVPLCYWK